MENDFFQPDNLDISVSSVPDVSSDQEEIEIEEDNQNGNQAQQMIDYSSYLDDIQFSLDGMQSELIDIKSDTLQCQENLYRLYYFIGGLYVVFFIVLAIKFFKQFF